MRADARRNVERIITAAREAFAERGTDASLDDVARRAGVGPGTLYRHFPNRSALVEAVYRDGVENLRTTGERLLAEEEPLDALVDWLRAFVIFVGEKRGLSMSLLSTIDNREALFRDAHESIQSTATVLIERAREAGAIRPDVSYMDLVRLASAIAIAAEQSPEGPAVADRLLSLALDGFRNRDEA